MVWNDFLITDWIVQRCEHQRRDMNVWNVLRRRPISVIFMDGSEIKRDTSKSLIEFSERTSSQDLLLIVRLNAVKCVPMVLERSDEVGGHVWRIEVLSQEASV